MIYKPNYASPNLESILSDDEGHIKYKLSGVSSDKFKTVRIGINSYGSNLNTSEDYNDGYVYNYVNAEDNEFNIIQNEDNYEFNYETQTLYKCQECGYLQTENGKCTYCGSDKLEKESNAVGNNLGGMTSLYIDPDLKNLSKSPKISLPNLNVANKEEKMYDFTNADLNRFGIEKPSKSTIIKTSGKINNIYIKSAAYNNSHTYDMGVAFIKNPTDSFVNELNNFKTNHQNLYSLNYNFSSKTSTQVEELFIAIRHIIEGTSYHMHPPKNIEEKECKNVKYIWGEVDVGTSTDSHFVKFYNNVNLDPCSLYLVCVGVSQIVSNELVKNFSYFYLMTGTNTSDIVNSDALWKTRMYEENSFKYDSRFTDDDQDKGKVDINYPFYMSHDYIDGVAFNPRVGLFNPETPKNREYYICTDYKPSSIIGYGLLQEVIKNDLDGKTAKNINSEDYNYTVPHHTLKIFPHSFHKYWSEQKGLSKGFDSYYARYYIKINGIYYNILDWTYIKGQKKDCLDGYGNPLAMYVEIGVPDNVPVPKANSDYTIYCNYMDSDEYPFTVVDEPKIEFREKKDFMDDENKKLNLYKDISQAFNNIKTLYYSNFELEGEYIQNGSYMSRYSCKLQQYKENINDYEDIYYSGYKFGQTVNFEYKDLIDGSTYLLTIKVANNQNIIQNYYMFIRVNYSLNKLETKNIPTEYNKDNASIILNLNGIHTMYGEESVKDAHKFKENNVMEIDFGNEIIYDGIGIPNEDVVIETLVKTVKGKMGKMLEVTTDEGITYSIQWNGSSYEFRKGDSVIKKYFLYTFSPEINEAEWETKFWNNLRVADKNTEIPYIFTENVLEAALDGNTGLYIHTEEASVENWYEIIITSKYICLKNINENKWHKIGWED